MKILDGKKVSLAEETKLIQRIKKYSRAPELAILVVGEREDSKAYVKQKIRMAERIGAKVRFFSFPENISEKKLIQEIESLNLNEGIDGIILQLPIPSHLMSRAIIDHISFSKDVDGLTTFNQGKILTGNNEVFMPATARGVITLLKNSGVSLLRKRVVVLGRSLLVGRPVALLAEREGATIIQCHSKTKKPEELTQLADILIVAVGKAKFLNEKYVKKGQVVVEVGITAVEKKGEKKLVGDVDFEKVSKIVKMISPVPGGVGPMTVVSLFENLCDAYERNVRGEK